MVFTSSRNSECTKILKSRYPSSSVEHWRRQHGHKKVKTPWYFSLCDTVRHGWKPWKLFVCMCISWQWSCGGARFKCGLLGPIWIYIGPYIFQGGGYCNTVVLIMQLRRYHNLFIAHGITDSWTEMACGLSVTLEKVVELSTHVLANL